MLTYTQSPHPANQLDCVLNIKHAVSRAFGHFGLLMCASCFRPVILILSTAFVYIFIKLPLVLSTESLGFFWIQAKSGKQRNKQAPPKNTKEKVFLSYSYKTAVENKGV